MNNAASLRRQPASSGLEQACPFGRVPEKLTGMGFLNLQNVMTPKEDISVS